MELRFSIEPEKTEYEGMYVKIYDGRIGKIINSYYRNEKIGKWRFWLDIDKDTYDFDREYNYTDILDNTKPTPNIIDLIEVGDYVNGEEIIQVINDGKMSRVKSIDGTYFENDIKSIVTKEQFESMEYKVGD